MNWNLFKLTVKITDFLFITYLFKNMVVLKANVVGM